MRLRIYTIGGELGTLELADGVGQLDVVAALRQGRFFLAPTDVAETAAAAAGEPAASVAPPSRRRQGGAT